MATKGALLPVHLALAFFLEPATMGTPRNARLLSEHFQLTLLVVNVAAVTTVTFGHSPRAAKPATLDTCYTTLTTRSGVDFAMRGRLDLFQQGRASVGAIS